MADLTTVKEPLFHIQRRADVTLKKAILIRSVGVVGGLIFCALLCTMFFSANPIKVIGEMFSGAFGTKRRIFELLKNTALLLGVGLALILAFKMKFWNLGGNGQVLMGGLATVACMINFGGKLPDAIVILMMLISGLLAGAVWAVIPAIFKALFNTNETLFTLMMNYIALGIVAICISIWDRTGSQTLGVIKEANLPVLGNDSILTILVVAILTAFIYIYLKHSKQGYELAVVGESENTARYVGINVKAVVIRTMIISGAICGLVGFLIVGSIDHSLSETTAKNMGFTAIIVAWLAKFNPLMMILTAFFVTFMSKGMGQVQSAFGITNNAISEMMIGVMYFIVIACEFFVSYKIKFKAKKSKEEKLEAPLSNEQTDTEKGGKE